MLENKRIAIVADWLTDRGGAERVVLELAEMFPQADIVTTVYKEESFPELANRNVITSYLQKWPLKFKHQLFVWARPQAVESLNLDNYDLVISSSSAEAKGVITKPETLHICYCHTPTRYFWSHYHAYLNQSEFGILDKVIKFFVPLLIHNLRIWDSVAAQRADVLAANSINTQQRIKKYYKRDSAVIYPPVDVKRFKLSTQDDGYYIVLGRQIAYKRTDLVVEAFNQTGKKLIVIGSGPELTRLENLAISKNIKFLGRISDEETTRYLENCTALIFPQEEDFGIVPLEAMACGKPVIAFNKGGARETVIHGSTGLLFNEQTPESLIVALQQFETMSFDPILCRQQAEKFSSDIFKTNFLNFINSHLK